MDTVRVIENINFTILVDTPAIISKLSIEITLENCELKETEYIRDGEVLCGP